jgi:hypothetical protein
MRVYLPADLSAPLCSRVVALTPRRPSEGVYGADPAPSSGTDCGHRGSGQRAEGTTPAPSAVAADPTARHSLTSMAFALPASLVALRVSDSPRPTTAPLPSALPPAG